MKILTALIVVLLCSGCNIHAGVGVHSLGLDGDNFSDQKLLGVVRASQRVAKDFEIYGEHISQPHIDDSGHGLNHIGLLGKFW